MLASSTFGCNPGLLGERPCYTDRWKLCIDCTHACSCSGSLNPAWTSLPFPLLAAVSSLLAVRARALHID
jgi:hypothetical protein